MIFMGLEEAVAEMKRYEKIVESYLSPDDSYWKIKGACIETLAILEGDEEKFKQCLEVTKRYVQGMGWSFDFDEYDAMFAASYIRTLAHLMKD